METKGKKWTRTKKRYKVAKQEYCANSRNLQKCSGNKAKVTEESRNKHVQLSFISGAFDAFSF